MASSGTHRSQPSAMIMADKPLTQNDSTNDISSNNSSNTDVKKRKGQNDITEYNNSIILTTVSNDNKNKNNSNNNNNNINTNNKNNNKRRKNKNNSSSSFSFNGQLQSARHCGLPQPGLSFEIWKLICQHLPPSQLVILVHVSVGMASIIRGLPIWKQIAEYANLGIPTTRGSRQTYYGIVISMSKRICERCFRKSKPTGRYASLKIHDAISGYPIHLCFPCRKEYYIKNPESYDPSRDGAVQRSSSYYLKLVHQYGGRVGYEESLRKGQTIIGTRNKNEKARRDERQNVLIEKLEGHGIWYDKTSDAFTNYVLDGKPDLEITFQVLSEIAATRDIRQARTDLIKEHLARMNLDEQYLFGLEAEQFVNSGEPQLNKVMEVVSLYAQADRARNRRRQELMDLLKELNQIDEADVKRYFESKKCQNYCFYGRQDLGELIGSIIKQIDEKQTLKKSQETHWQNNMNLLHDHRKELKDAAWYLNEERLSEYARCQWTDINGIIRQIKRDASQEQRKTQRREELEQRVRGCGLDFDENKYEYHEYISRGYGSVDEIVALALEWDWVLRETKEGYNNHHRMNRYNRAYHVTQALIEYISNRLMNLELGSPRNDPCTLGRPPRSLWEQIDRIALQEWRKHAKKCTMEGLLLNNDTKETISHNVPPNEYATTITNQALITAMNQGAEFLALTNTKAQLTLNNNYSSVFASSSSATETIITTTQFTDNSSSPLSIYATRFPMDMHSDSSSSSSSTLSYLTQPTTNIASSFSSASDINPLEDSQLEFVWRVPLFSVALRDMLGGEENFNDFLEESRVEIIRQARTKLRF